MFKKPEPIRSEYRSKWFRCLICGQWRSYNYRYYDKEYGETCGKCMKSEQERFTKLDKNFQPFLPAKAVGGCKRVVAKPSRVTQPKLPLVGCEDGDSL